MDDALERERRVLGPAVEKQRLFIDNLENHIFPCIGEVPLVAVDRAVVKRLIFDVRVDFASWNQIGKWLRRVEALRDAA